MRTQDHAKNPQGRLVAQLILRQTLVANRRVHTLLVWCDSGSGCGILQRLRASG
jgi:hypothetical protein